MKYEAPADQIVYKEDPATGRFFRNSDPVPSGFVAPIPNCWSRFLWALWQDLPIVSGRAVSPPVFLHERSAQQAEHGLLSVYFDGWAGKEFWQFHADIYRRNGNSEYYFPVDIRGVQPGSLRLFAGQWDPSDSSHFTIGYECGGQKGTIDGWLQNGDSIKMQVRDGPAKPH